MENSLQDFDVQPNLINVTLSIDKFIASFHNLGKHFLNETCRKVLFLISLGNSHVKVILACQNSWKFLPYTSYSSMLVTVV